MSRLHAFLIALFATGAIAVGVATAFTVAGSPSGAGSELNSDVLQRRADKINEAEARIAKKVADNPAPDRSPVIRTRTVGSAVSSSGGVAAPTVSGGGSTTTTRDDDDDHGRNRGRGGDDEDRSGSGGGAESDDD